MSSEISSILSQIRAFNPRSQAALDVAPGNAVQFDRTPTGAVKAPGFSETMSRMMDGVSGAQSNSAALARAFEQGDPSADLARVMVASQNAQVAFRATVEVRNRVVQAYQEVMNMPI